MRTRSLNGRPERMARRGWGSLVWSEFMPRLVLDNNEVLAEIEPAVGGSLAAFGVRRGDTVVPLMRSAKPRATWFNDMACYTLAPWSNRIRSGSFSFRGKQFSPGADWPDGTAIHGLVKDKQFLVEQRTPVSAMLGYSGGGDSVWPWRFRCEVIYELRGGGIKVSIILRNESHDFMPAGLGFHPFWRRSSHTAVRLPGLRRYPCVGMMPTGVPIEDDVTRHLAAGLPLETLSLDEVFLGSSFGATIEWPDLNLALRYECSREFSHTVIFTGAPDENGHMPTFFCLEPVSMVNDGFNLLEHGWKDTGVRVLKSGEAIEAAWSFHTMPL